MAERFEISEKGAVTKYKCIQDNNAKEYGSGFLTFYPRLTRVNGKLEDIKPIDDAKMVCNALNLYESLGKLKGKPTKAELFDLFKKYGL